MSLFTGMNSISIILHSEDGIALAYHYQEFGSRQDQNQKYYWSYEWDKDSSQLNLQLYVKSQNMV